MTIAGQSAYRVFLSHTGDDSALARYLAIEIEGAGAEAFTYRRDGAIGEEPDEMIEREISESDELLLLLTPKSLDRMYIGYEYGFARARGLWISATRFHLSFSDVNETTNIVAGLKEKQFDLNNDMQRYTSELAERVSQKTQRIRK